MFFFFFFFFSTSGRSNETIASLSTDVSCTVALQTALIDTAVDLSGGMRVTSGPTSTYCAQTVRLAVIWRNLVAADDRGSAVHV